MTWWRRATLGLLLSWMAATSVAAQSTGLTRLTGRDALLGWEAIGRLDAKGIGFCTGTLIAPDLVLTAAHCVFNPRTGAPLDPGSLTFRAGLRDGEAIAERRVARIAAHPTYRPGAGMHRQNVLHDVALLKLTEQITSSDADPFILHTGPIDGYEVSVTSYGKGRAEALSRQRACQILGRQGDLIAFDCNVTFGSSGAPVFIKTGNRGRILSIISGGTRNGDDVFALGMSLPEVVRELKAQLRQPTKTAPGTIRRITVGSGQGDTGAKFVKP